jgi:hypothetical protein
MKTRLIALIMTVFMVISLFAVGASAAAPNYASAANGDELYKLNFNGDDVYKPFVFRMSDSKMSGTTTVVSDDGYTLTATAPADAAKAWFYGGAINGLTIGTGKQYTITFQMSFPSGRAGFYFNFGYAKETDDPLKNNDYNGLYGFYGRLYDKNVTLSRAAGGKIDGDLRSLNSGYSEMPDDAAKIAKDVLADVKVEIDGYFYSVWFKATDATDWVLYDHVNMLNTDKAGITYFPCPNLGFSIYLYNNNSKTVVKDVVIKKGVEHTAASLEDPFKVPANNDTAIDYNAAKSGDKLTDLVFNAKSGPYIAENFANSAKNNTETVSEDGKTYTSVIPNAADNANKGAVWFGDRIGKLKITDNTKYTFKYKLKTTSDSTYVAGIAFNAAPSGFKANRPGNRLNWYGHFTNTSEFNFTINDTPVKNAVKYAHNGTNFTGYGYSDANMAGFTTFVPALDADGYADVAVELNGWTWTYYEKDAEGKYVAIQTVDNKEILKSYAGLTDTTLFNDLAFMIYTYNSNVECSVKDAELYKGTVISVDYTTTTEPEVPVITGDSALIVMIIAAVSLLGMGIALRARKA